LVTPVDTAHHRGLGFISSPSFARPKRAPPGFTGQPLRLCWRRLVPVADTRAGQAAMVSSFRRAAPPLH
jgi:hypothetical protein